MTKPAWVNIETGREMPKGSANPILSSANSPWQGVYIEKLAGMSVEQVNVAALSHLVIVQLDRPTHFEWQQDGRSEMVRLPAGHISVFPAMQPYSVRCHDTREFLSISIDPTFLLCSAQDTFQAGRFELIPRHGVDDPLVRAVALALMDEVRSDYPGGRWYGESLGSTLAVHLVRHYSTAHTRVRQIEDGLARQQLRVTLEYVEQHLAEDIPLQTLSAVCELSAFHFARLFKRSVGLAPHQYVIQRRVERARELLLTSRQSVAQIAQQVGFCDQSHLTIHFKRAFGMPPKQFVRQYGLTSRAVV